MSRDKQLRQQAQEAIQKHQALAESDPYRPAYHIAPPVGLINDPNGWIQWNGTYHLFYQWMPFKTGHGAKFWGHVTSQNLVDWKDEPIALTPSNWFDKDGCYSGSAIDHEGKLHLFYTGNVKENGEREAYQCLAVSEDGIHFTKEGVQIEVPEGYTAHFRDPKVWKENDKWYMVIGAQKLQNEGSVVWFHSVDLKKWEFGGTLANGYGYMWECPDFFSLNGEDVLIFSPQGLSASGIDYRNVHQTGYIHGKWNKEEKFQYGKFVELDRGFEFYAPQTTLDEQGRRILFGWMGVPDQGEDYHPTTKYQWIHQLTLPRELLWENNQIYQKPVKELKKLRETSILQVTTTGKWQGKIEKSSELILEDIKSEKYHMNLFDYATIDYDKNEKTITITRPCLDGSGLEERVGILSQDLQQIRCFIDHSSLELFANDGELVFTSRIFAEPENTSLSIEGEGKISAWSLHNKG
ncbi:sucrose-6-phosphate hydrolase [Gracilibacillus sp. YIM 98692]|uniref:glycoside hydrolase family 32 protein n=1 Tax=Gracilibacillus sp. YIM 98692 TaxID=2663532 RepID=UPI0013D142C3|nr:sucrose-6-phosphate hydrolase [Gracilibacillus sp. YIM 98692]